MKKQFALIAAGILVMISGCSTPTALQAPVGPNPMAAKNTDPDGMLQVFSATEQQNNVGFEFPYSQRTEYYIEDSSGNEIRRILDNNKGEFEAIPRPIQLAPGTYRIKALAAVGTGEWITVPVVIESGRTTEVHLNGHWKPPVDTPQNELVRAPSGFPMGWRAGGSPNS